jgi:hypothetical protein
MQRIRSSSGHLWAPGFPVRPIYHVIEKVTLFDRVCFSGGPSFLLHYIANCSILSSYHYSALCCYLLQLFPDVRWHIDWWWPVILRPIEFANVKDLIQAKKYPQSYCHIIWKSDLNLRLCGRWSDIWNDFLKWSWIISEKMTSLKDPLKMQLMPRKNVYNVPEMKFFCSYALQLDKICFVLWYFAKHAIFLPNEFQVQNFITLCSIWHKNLMKNLKILIILNFSTDTQHILTKQGPKCLESSLSPSWQ